MSDKKFIGLKPLLLSFLMLAGCKDNSISGLTKILNEKEFTYTAPLKIKNESNLVLKDLKITNPDGPCIEITNSNNIIITDSWIGSCKGEGIKIVESENITLTQNFIENTATGIYAVDSKKISVKNNEFKNMQGPMPRGQAVQFDKINGGDNKIIYNYILNETGKNNSEDIINLYKSNGDYNSNILVENNYIKGGGISSSGGGIMTGDGGGSYQKVRFNVVKNPGQYGVAISSGNNISIEENKIYSANIPQANVGLYVLNQYNEYCYNNSVQKNHVYFKNKKGIYNHAYNSKNFVKGTKGPCKNTKGWQTNVFGSKEVSNNMSAPKNSGITNWKGPLTKN